MRKVFYFSRFMLTFAALLATLVLWGGFIFAFLFFANH